jgi:pSer/pThr/pTyr-binding forkhead associated (FHA) protein
MPQLSLEIVEGAGAGRRVAVTGSLTIGRGRDADLVLADELVSRRHAQVAPDGPGAVVEDLGSRNGTFVNGEAIHGLVRLRPGDQLQLGVTLVELRSTRQIAERPSAVQPVPPPLAVRARAPDYLPGPADTPGPEERPGVEVAAEPAPSDGPGPPAAPRPAAGRPWHELDPLLDSRTKGKARTAPLALFVLVALVVIIYLAAAR